MAALGSRLKTLASGNSPRSELASALLACRRAFLGVAVFSALLNILYLTGSFFMLEVYDRVLGSRNIPTLVGLCVLAFVLYAFQGVLDVIRTRVLVRISGSMDEAVSHRVFQVMAVLPIKAPLLKNAQPLRDLDQIRAFMSTVGPSALFDLPWMPFYLGLCYLFHPWIGIAAGIGGLILISVTLMTEISSREPTREAAQLAGTRNSLAEASRRNAEVVEAMGMAGYLGKIWGEANRNYILAQRRAADVVGGMGGLSKILRMALQSGVLGLGAYLVINQQATGGVILASSVLTSRALAPVELAIAHWKGFVAARLSWRRLGELLEMIPAEAERMELPKPVKTLAVETVSVSPPGSPRIVVQEVAFQLTAGQGVGIIGPSASGKSSLARAIVGVWPVLRGKIRMDGAAIDQWSSEARGPHVGYLPQDMELFAGTVAQNISRFAPNPDAKAVIAAAKAASVDELVLGLPEGYDTQIGDSGASLSAGQRQRIGLARALYGNPFLVVLDEPNSNLDNDGENALTKAILGVRARGGIVVVIAHRPSAIAGVDNVLMMRGGRQQSFGPKESVLRQALAPAPGNPPAAPAAAPAAAPVAAPAALAKPQTALAKPQLVVSRQEPKKS